jgi:release factor glutamine methyltransferase
VINPPYYKKDPKSESEYAWYCGENLEYFSKLFLSLKNYVQSSSKTIMILSNDCDIEGIQKIASRNHFTLKEVERKKIFWEQNYIFEIVPK